MSQDTDSVIAKPISQLPEYTGSPDQFTIPGIDQGTTKKANLGTLITKAITADTTKASASQLSALTQQVSSKANQSEVTQLSSKVDGLTESVSKKTTSTPQVVAYKAYTYSEGAAVGQETANGWNCCIVTKTNNGDYVRIVGKSGTSYPFYIKIKNGKCVSQTSLSYGSRDVRVDFDESFDQIAINGADALTVTSTVLTPMSSLIDSLTSSVNGKADASAVSQISSLVNAHSLAIYAQSETEKNYTRLGGGYFGYSDSSNSITLWNASSETETIAFYAIDRTKDIYLDFTLWKVYTNDYFIGFFNTATPSNAQKSTYVILPSSFLEEGAASGSYGIKYKIAANTLPVGTTHVGICYSAARKLSDFKLTEVSIDTSKTKLDDYKQTNDSRVSALQSSAITSAKIADNLFTNDSSKVLSAKQGYNLSKMLQEDYDVSKSETSETAGILKSDGSVGTEASSVYVSDFIAIGSGLKILDTYCSAYGGVRYVVFAEDKTTVISSYAGTRYSHEDCEISGSAGAYVRFQSFSQTYNYIEHKKRNIDVSEIKKYIDKAKVKVLTAVGSSGFDCHNGGQYGLTNSQKSTYGVTADLTITKVVQKLLGYNVANVCAYGGYTASAQFFRNGDMPYILNTGVTLPKTKANVSYSWDLTNVSCPMVASMNNIKKFPQFEGVVNGVSVIVNPQSNTIKLNENCDNDVVISAGSLLYAKPYVSNSGTYEVQADIVRQGIHGSEGILLQIGANSEGATVDEIVDFFELAIKRSGAKWFVAMVQNISQETSDLNKAKNSLKAKYGSSFIDHLAYLKTVKALQDQGITPTTSASYPDASGANSNPLTSTQIANGVPCDLECIANDRVPSSFWHSAYRDGEEQAKNEGHFNAQGLECVGKYIYRMIKLQGIA